MTPNEGEQWSKNKSDRTGPAPCSWLSDSLADGCSSALTTPQT